MKTLDDIPITKTQDYNVTVSVVDYVEDVDAFESDQYVYFRTSDDGVNYGDWVVIEEELEKTSTQLVGRIEIDSPIALNEGVNRLYVQAFIAEKSTDLGNINNELVAINNEVQIIYDGQVPRYKIHLDESDATNKSVYGSLTVTDNYSKAESLLVYGSDSDKFTPNGALTRGMLVTILWRAEGEPEAGYSKFDDVSEYMYYADAVAWAESKGIVKGVSDTKFAPDDNILREQFAAIMYRYVMYKNYDVSVGESTSLASYSDANTISEYAVSAMQYAVGSGLLKGKSATTLNPKDNATRAESATILQRFIETHK